MIPVIDVTRVIEWAITAARTVAVFIATKVLIIAVVGALVPLAILAGWKLIQAKIFTAIDSVQPDTWQGTMVQFTGIAAYIADNIYLPQAVALVITALSVAWTLSWLKGR